jgi:hypothetical protein
VGDAVPVAISIDGVPTPAGVTLAIRSALAGSGVALTSGYVPKAAVFKGQLHVHSTATDGTQDPAAVVRAYLAAGYDFISLTDHNRVTPDPLVPGILFIPGTEQDPNGNHLNRIGVPDVLPGNEQAVIDGTLAQGGFIFLNHPNRPDGYPGNPNWTDAELEAVRGYHGLEVWNAAAVPTNNAEGRADFLLSRGRRLFLLATDDCHNVNSSRCKTTSTWVFADRLAPAEILASLTAGNFYASSGAIVSSVSVSGPTVTVATDRLSTIDFIAAGGRVVQSTTRTFAAAYSATGDETYVRARVTRDSDGAAAWTNPVYVER